VSKETYYSVKRDLLT
jgi:hypothetical protein